MLPALVSIMIVFVILSLHLHQSKASTELITQSGASSTLWQFEPNIFVALNQGLWQIFTTTLDARHYNPVLWTMQYEFIGSFLVFGFLLLFGTAKHRWIAYIILVLVFMNTWYMGFVIGMIFADLYAHKRELATRYFNKKIQLIGWVFLAGGLIIGGYPLVDPQGGFYNLLYIKSIPVGANLINYTILGAGMVVFSVLTVPRLSIFFKNPKVSRLGKYTYSLYLTHLPILFVVSTSIFVVLVRVVEYKLATVGAISMTVPIIAVSAWLFEKYVDAPSIRLSGRFYQWFESK